MKTLSTPAAPLRFSPRPPPPYSLIHLEQSHTDSPLSTQLAVTTPPSPAVDAPRYPSGLQATTATAAREAPAPATRAGQRMAAVLAVCKPTGRVQNSEGRRACLRSPLLRRRPYHPPRPASETATAQRGRRGGRRADGGAGLRGPRLGAGAG